MRKIIVTIFLIISITEFISARKVTVSLSTDNTTTPTVGMLRYHINNALDKDTIIFSVSTVNLLGKITTPDLSRNGRWNVCIY